MESGEKPSADQASTAPLDPNAVDYPFEDHNGLHFDFGMAQAVDAAGGAGERSLYALAGGADGDHRIPDFGIFCLADGGSSDPAIGEISVRTVARSLTQSAVLALMASEDASLGSGEDLLRVAMEMARREVLAHDKGAFLSLASALVIGDQVTIAATGGTQVFITRSEKIEALASPVSEGKARRNDDAGIALATLPVPSGEVLLLCSAGLWEAVPPERIHDILLLEGDPQRACDALLAAAGIAGRPDAILIAIAFP